MKEKGKLIGSPESEAIERANQALTKLNNYAVVHSDVIDASWVIKVIEEVRAELREAESPRQPQSLVPSHGAAGIGAGAENTAGVRDLTTRTPMPPTNCWCSNDSATCKKCWPERAESPRQTDSNWSVKELIEMAEKLLEWMPIYSKGSSGNIRQTNLRAAIEKFKVEHPEPAKWIYL